MEKTNKAKLLYEGKSGTLLIILIVTIAVFYIINPLYLSPENIKTIFNSCTASGFLAVGMACLLISGNIDLSAGAVGMFSGIIIAYMLQTPLPWGISLIISVMAACCLGLFNAFLVNVLNFVPFISTLGVMTLLTGLGGGITNGQPLFINNKAFWELGSITVLNVIPLLFIIMVLVFIIYGVILSSTRFGRRMYMCGGNKDAARLAGINYKKVSTILFVNNAVMAAFSGIVFTSRMHNAIWTSIAGQEMVGLTAAVLGGVGFKGGTGGMLGTFIGLILLNSFTSGLLVAGLGDYWRVVANGVLLIVALTLDFLKDRSRAKSQKAAAMTDV